MTTVGEVREFLAGFNDWDRLVIDTPEERETLEGAGIDAGYREIEGFEARAQGPRVVLRASQIEVFSMEPVRT